MRWSLPLFLFPLVAFGCASRPVEPAHSCQAYHRCPPVAPVAIEDSAVAAALVFDPPIMANNPALDLSRSARNPAAFVSFDQTITTFYFLRSNDRQIIGAAPYAERRAVTERFGVSYR